MTKNSFLVEVTFNKFIYYIYLCWGDQDTSEELHKPQERNRDGPLFSRHISKIIDIFRKKNFLKKREILTTMW